MRIIKRISAIVLCALMSFQIFGCALIKNAKNDPKKLEKPDAEKIFEYIKDEDIDSLCDLFSHEVKKNHDLEKEWEDFFEKMDGKAVSYKKISFPNEGVGTDKDGEVYKMHVAVNYNNLKTDKGTVYKQFGYQHIRVSKSDPDSVGLLTFTMQDPDTGEWTTVGER